MRFFIYFDWICIFTLNQSLVVFSSIWFPWFPYVFLTITFSFGISIYTCPIDRLNTLNIIWNWCRMCTLGNDVGHSTKTWHAENATDANWKCLSKVLMTIKWFNQQLLRHSSILYAYWLTAPTWHAVISLTLLRSYKAEEI